MPDSELQWIPDETTPAIPVRTRVVSIVVFAAIFLAIGVVIGRLTAGIPANTGSEAIRRPSPEKSSQSPVEPPSMALKGEEPPIQKPASSPAPQTKQTPSPPVVLNPSSAEEGPGQEDVGKRARAVRERRIESTRRENRERAPDDQRDVFSRPMRDYQSLRQYMSTR